jgi:mannitol 2-dehydrogenase
MMAMDPIAISRAALPSLARRGIAVPDYEQARAVPGIVHIGVGGFHRAHQAVYLDELAALGGRWRICGVGPRAPDAAMADALDAQDCLYTVVARGPEGTTVRVVGSIVEYSLGGDDLGFLIEAVARPETSIVSLTITEAGYGTDRADREVGVFAAIAAGAQQRHDAGLPPLTVMSCDNIRHNGEVARDATLRATHVRGAIVERWVEREWAFPSSMVDRITPATSDTDREWLRDKHGIDDRWPVMTERFRQWVLEDAFANGRPALETVGVIFTERVADWETYKLRMLNATHSVLAYPAALAGIEWVDEALATPELRHLVDTFLQAEALPTISPIEEHPPGDYAASVLARFGPGGIRDQIARLCVDGTVKFATFVMPTVVDQVARGGPVVAGATALAAWAHYLAVVPAFGQAPDAFAEEARRYAADAVDDPVRFLAFRRVVPLEVARDPAFRSAFTDQLRSFAEAGPLRTAARAAG